MTDPSVAPDAVENVPTVVVGPSGLELGAPSGGDTFVASVLTTSGLTVTADAEYGGHTVLNDGVALNADLAVRGKHAVRGTDTWLRLNQDNAFTSGTHTPGFFALGSLNVGGYEKWGNPGGGNALIAGSLYVHGRVQLGGGDEQVIIGGNQTGPFMQLRDDTWLSDPQDGTIELKNAVFGWGRLKGIFLAVSSETYKKDVAPLAADELSGLLTDALATEVVHFRYREEDDDQPTRLGIIAEQAPATSWTRPPTACCCRNTRRCC